MFVPKRVPFPCPRHKKAQKYLFLLLQIPRAKKGTLSLRPAPPHRKAKRHPFLLLQIQIGARSVHFLHQAPRENAHWPSPIWETANFRGNVLSSASTPPRPRGSGGPRIEFAISPFSGSPAGAVLSFLGPLYTLADAKSLGRFAPGQMLLTPCS